MKLFYMATSLFLVWIGVVVVFDAVVDRKATHKDRLFCFALGTFVMLIGVLFLIYTWETL